MRLLFELSMECEPLSRSEVRAVGDSLGGCAPVLDAPGLMVADCEADPRAIADRVALCHVVSEYIGSCEAEEVETFASEVDVPGPVRVHSTRIGTASAELRLEDVNRAVGGVIGERADVDLHRPASEVRVVFSDRAYFGRRMAAVDRASFEERKTKNLPYDHPISLHPKFARCLVNLARVGEGERLLDPFCGTGAILAEARLVGAEAIGADVSDRMIAGTRENLASLGLQASLVESDVGALPGLMPRVDGIATDPPYGRSASTAGEPVPRLMGRAFGAFADLLEQGGLVAMAMHDPSLCQDVPSFRLLERHELWVHRSLTRHFCVLERV